MHIINPNPLRIVTPVMLFVALLVAMPAVADLDVVFVIDTTGSMSGELREVQERARQLAGSLAEARVGERLRYGVVAFRDRGDAYVTLLFDLNQDVGATDEFLAGLDCLLIATDHSSCDYDSIVRHAPLVVDTRNATKHVTEGREKICKA